MRTIATKTEVIEEFSRRAQVAKDNAKAMTGTAKAQAEGQAKGWELAAAFLRGWEEELVEGPPQDGHGGPADSGHAVLPGPPWGGGE